MNEILSVEEAAELLDCSTEVIEERTRQRTLPGIKYGRSWRYPREALLKVLNDQALDHTKPVPKPAVRRLLPPPIVRSV